MYIYMYVYIYIYIYYIYIDIYIYFIRPIYKKRKFDVFKHLRFFTVASPEYSVPFDQHLA